MAFVENRDDRHIIRVMDSAVQRVVGNPDVPVFDARILTIVGEDVLDQDRLDNGVQVGSRRSIDQVALGGKDGHHHISRNAHGTAAGALKDLQSFIQDIVGALEADLVVTRREFRYRVQLLLRGWYYLNPLQLLFCGGNRHRLLLLSLNS